MVNLGPSNYSQGWLVTTSSRAFGTGLLCVGLLAIQLLWLVVIPPYGGIDEFDHAYRAASVADGHWAPRHQRASHGRGDLIPVPEKIVRAAHAACSRLPYTRHDNCNPVSPPNASGEVLVASAAATYNPLFYFFIGTVAKPIHSGTAALYAMRAAALMLCDALILGALLVVGSTARTLWPLSAVLLAGTPMVLYSTAMAAPNGLQACAALLMWSALLPAATRRWNARTSRLLWIGSGSAAVVMLTHSTGPLWVLLTVVALVLAAGRSWIRDALAYHRLSFLAPMSVALLGAVLSTAWIIWQGTNSPAGDAAHFGGPDVSATLLQPLLWLFQSVAAIPFRDQAAPVTVYAIGLSLFAAMLVLGWRAGWSGLRRLMVFVASFSFLVPAALSLTTYHELGFAWQGRYTLPFAFGIVIAAGFALDASLRFRGASWVAALVTSLGSVVMEIRELLYVCKFEHQLSGTWASVGLVAACAASAALLCAGVALLARTPAINPADSARELSAA